LSILEELFVVNGQQDIHSSLSDYAEDNVDKPTPEKQWGVG
jgi:hypothetical protein